MNSAHAEKALRVIDPGAVNPSGILHSMLEIIKDLRHESPEMDTEAICGYAPLIVMVEQLYSLFGNGALFSTAYHEILEEMK